MKKRIVDQLEAARSELVTLTARGDAYAVEVRSLTSALTAMTAERDAEKVRADHHVNLCGLLEGLTGVRGIDPASALRLPAKDHDGASAASTEALLAGLHACKTQRERSEFLRKNQAGVEAYFAAKTE